ncbi:MULTISPECIES: MFS transporter [Streptomyces]|uniref:MFS transporter n=1 Tax=Streptomyces tsukubensis (strain DSM 42081 / NBRC 108919 / NRRL 18488 / 9993) TaxID=1114943 RepID=I2MYY8_STRT9|nr:MULTISPECIES: MFS transporter [Streptomyces]AZK94280.1 MFS transporter [Streptomyces tsukubensis]EIF89985.1 major facilitator superfamily permease [Streptomyces tsukubensis NRRL18488]MYS66343.1 MFS transporter [Streptomyces sp. SID5473]QKM69624.1 MFS transporter [Streptomyces tsukubensis NRRL18488]TAI46414.1 MFS transporter [Streptomyces tsukubensis]
MSALEPRGPEVTQQPAGPVISASQERPLAVDTGPDALRPEDGVLSRTYRALSIGIIAVVLLIAFEATAVGTAMPVAARELNGVEVYAFAFSSYFTTSLLGMVVAGQWADRDGPLRPLATGIAAFAVGLVLSGTATAMWLFILGRAVQGLGGGLVIVALYVVIGRAYPEHLRPKILAAFAASWIIPSIVGPLASGTVTEQLGWRWVFLGIPALVVFPLALALPAIRRMTAGPADPSAPRAPFDRHRIRLALAISIGAGLLQYSAQDLVWLSLIPAAAGAALLVPAVLGLLPKGTYRAARGLPSVVLLRGVAAGSFIAAESFIPLMLVTQRGLSPTMAGFSLAAGGLTWAAGSFLQSRPRMEPYREKLMATGMVLCGLAIAAAPTVLIDAVPVWTLAITWALGCFGMGMVIASTSVMLLKLSAPEEAGANSAALQISDGLSNIMLLAAGGAAFAALGGGAVGHHAATAASSSGGSHPAAFAVVFIPMALVAILGAWVTTRLKPPVAEAV